MVTGPDFTTVIRQPWLVEQVAIPTTTTTVPPSSTSSSSTGSSSPTTTAPPPTTSTTEPIGFLPETPDGTAC